MVQAAEEATTEQQYYYATGKRKTSIARVRLYREDTRRGEFSINGRSLQEAFSWFTWQDTIKQPFRVTGTEGNFYVVATIEGGGVSSQAQALRHGIARALAAYDEAFKKPLREHGLLTRDARIKESKKYGLKRARRAPQYTKR